MDCYHCNHFLSVHILASFSLTSTIKPATRIDSCFSMGIILSYLCYTKLITLLSPTVH